MVDNVSKPLELHQDSEQFLKASGMFVSVSGAEDSWAGIGSMLSNWLRPGWLGGPRISWKLLMVGNDQAQLANIGRWMKEGNIKIVVDSTFGFGDALRAFERLRTGRARGKVVIRGVGR